VYDYPYLSSSANHIVDISSGYSAASVLSSSANMQNAKKINLYNQMAQVLMGHDISGSIQPFDADGNLGGEVSSTNFKMREVVFLPLSRLLVKDEVKKGTFSMDIAMGTGSINDWDKPHECAQNTTSGHVRVSDTGAASTYYVNSPAGEYGRLFVKNTAGTVLHPANGTVDGTELSSSCGLIFYQAGVVVLTSSLFHHRTNTAHDPAHGFLSQSAWISLGGGLVGAAAGCGLFCTGSETTAIQSITGALAASTMDHIGNHIRNRITNISFNNTTELNSTVFFCRANHNEFNYSSNPTYLDGSKLRVKNVRTDAPKSYITTVGLYGPKSELLAVAKISEPLRKDPTNEVTLRVRLDY
jgi:hypothetical protein